MTLSKYEALKQTIMNELDTGAHFTPTTTPDRYYTGTYGGYYGDSKFDTYQHPAGNFRKLNMIGFGKKQLAMTLSKTDEIAVFYNMLQLECQTYGIAITSDPTTVGRWEDQQYPPTMPYTVDTFDSPAHFAHVQRNSSNAIFHKIKEYTSDDFAEAQNFITQFTEKVDGYALLYQLLALVMTKIRVSSKYEVEEPTWEPSDTVFTITQRFSRYIDVQKEEIQMTPTFQVQKLLKKLPTSKYGKTNEAILEKLKKYTDAMDVWKAAGKPTKEPSFPRDLQLDYIAFTIDEELGRTEAIRGISSVPRGRINKGEDTHNNDIYCQPTASDAGSIQDDDQFFNEVFKINMAKGGDSTHRQRRDIYCIACRGYGHCLEKTGQCDQVALQLNVNRYIQNNKTTAGAKYLKEAITGYDRYQSDRRRKSLDRDRGRQRRSLTPNRGRSPSVERDTPRSRDSSRNRDNHRRRRTTFRDDKSPDPRVRRTTGGDIRDIPAVTDSDYIIPDNFSGYGSDTTNDSNRSATSYEE